MLLQEGLRPFTALQGLVSEEGARRVRVEALQEELDSLSAMMSTHRAVTDENRTLRKLLDLREALGYDYRPATISRPGTPGSESTFLVNVGTGDGVRASAPVLSPAGLVGVIRESRSSNAVGIDWTHPDFRSSAMLADGSVYGMVESRRGDFREDDRLILNGIPYHQEVALGQVVLTSGLGGVFPRGIAIGTVLRIEEEEGAWRKAYVLDPAVAPGSATHVLVLVGESADSVNLSDSEGEYR
tara:strand:- start:13 stop:738 length:726 start_codon:yes stop_codon:yes gene_type:complete